MIDGLLSLVRILFDFDVSARLETSFASRNDDNTAPGENNIVDKCSNMLCLSPELRRSWERGLFGLEPVGHCRRLKGSEDSWEVMDAKLSELDLDGTGSEEDETIDAKLSSIFTSASDTEPVTTHNVSSKQSSKVGMDLDNDSEKPRTDEKGKVPETFSKGRPLLKQDIDDGSEYGIVLRFHWLPATTLTSLNAESPPLDTNPRDIQAPLDNSKSKHHAFSGRPVTNGRIIRIWAKTPDELPNWDALQLQWFALRVLRLGGDVDPEIYNPHWTDNDENFSRRVVNDREGLRQELFMEMVLSTSGQMRQCWEKGLFTFEPVGYCRRSKVAGEVSELSSIVASTSISDSTATTAHTDSMPSTQEATVKARTPDANDDEASDLFNEGRRLQESDIDAGKEYGIVLRVRWLLKTTTLSSLMDSAPPLDTDPRDLQESWEELYEELEGLSVLPKNGELIRIWAQDPQELPNWTALELRWTALRIHCLSGRANPEKYNPGFSDVDEQFWIDLADYLYVKDNKVAFEQLQARMDAYVYPD
ncbi:hypothetical protein COL26b_006525 [Colletotrichum chrysophilum]|uniref:uncharacterized protein n=1 Tax=Colletotrichum chrysophilum TaxID=1836956 RepID=UPI0023008CE8|nr:uncharacterized protein COL26b_006525 [Colletotrichum chrysophilum]KAJ0375314.1 hypothetical protein COL26b_006525 [Colletotrichum chrysophilum]